MGAAAVHEFCEEEASAVTKTVLIGTVGKDECTTACLMLYRCVILGLHFGYIPPRKNTMMMIHSGAILFFIVFRVPFCIEMYTMSSPFIADASHCIGIRRLLCSLRLRYSREKIALACARRPRLRCRRCGQIRLG